ncbi:MAG: GIY-YIG nuclease family protein [candidate division Zixibacteria bacterium]|nr:GIY-YIG nuclease family protein [candidate division Zixibacteria bacterium]
MLYSVVIKQGFVYILTNKTRTVLYTGITSNLSVRIQAHKDGNVEGFTKRYKLTRLVYIEVFNRITDAITREKQIKSWSRSAKVKLILESNPDWLDLSEQL